MKKNLLILTAFLFSLSAYSQCDNGEFKTVNYYSGEGYHIVERDGKIYQRTTPYSVSEITDAFEIKDGLLSIKCGDETLEMDQLYSDKVDLEAVAKDLAGALDKPAGKGSLCTRSESTTTTTTTTTTPPVVITDPTTTTTTTSTDCGCTLSKKCQKLQAKVCKELKKVKKGDAKRLKLTEKANKKKIAAIAKAEKKEKATLKKIEACKIKQYKKLDKKNKKFQKSCAQK